MVDPVVGEIVGTRSGPSLSHTSIGDPLRGMTVLCIWNWTHFPKTSVWSLFKCSKAVLRFLQNGQQGIREEKSKVLLEPACPRHWLTTLTHSFLFSATFWKEMGLTWIVFLHLASFAWATPRRFYYKYLGQFLTNIWKHFSDIFGNIRNKYWKIWWLLMNHLPY